MNDEKCLNLNALEIAKSCVLKMSISARLEMATYVSAW